jgi:hypothetical protein
LGIATLSLVVTVDRVFGARAPGVAARWGSGAAVTQAARADRLAQPGGSRAGLIEAERLARRALLREPSSVPAVRVLGQAAALRGDLPRANRLFRYSEQLSRRDLLTQIWLIEEGVRRGDIAGTLTHYDRALRTVGRARAVLFPVLISAMSTPDVAAGAERLMAQRTAWGPDFLAVMAQSPNASPDALARLAMAARLRPDVAAERGSLDAILQRLVASGRHVAAYTLWRRVLGVPGAGTRVRNGGFESDPLPPPFDWRFANEGDRSATREPSDTGIALVLRATNGTSGEFARQLLLLQPGRYRIDLTSSGASADRLSHALLAVTCAAGGELLRLPLSAVAKTRLNGAFSVPPGCRAQTLTIAAPTGLGDGNDGVIVDDVTIVPVQR